MSSKGKTYKKNWGPKMGPEIGFLVKFGSLFFL